MWLLLSCRPRRPSRIWPDCYLINRERPHRSRTKLIRTQWYRPRSQQDRDSSYIREPQITASFFYAEKSWMKILPPKRSSSAISSHSSRSTSLCTIAILNSTWMNWRKNYWSMILPLASSLLTVMEHSTPLYKVTARKSWTSLLWNYQRSIIKEVSPRSVLLD